MLFPWLTPLVAAFALCLLAVIVAKRSSEGELPQVFVFFAVVLCFWNLNFFVLYSVDDVEVLWDLSRTLRTGTLFLPPAILHLFLSIEPIRSPIWQRILVVDYAIGAVLALLNAFDLLVLNLHHVDYGYVSVGRTGYNIFAVFALLNAIAALLVLVHYYQTSREPRSRQQLTFWIAGSAFATPLVLMNLLPAYGVPIYPPGNLASALWAGVIGYAIVRHRLLDIELVVSRGLSYIVVATGFLFPLGIGLLGLQLYAFGKVDYNATVGLVTLCVVTSVSFSYVRTWLETRFESSLLREKREARETLVSFGKGVVRMLDEPRILRELVQCVKDALHLQNVCIVSADDGDRRYRLRLSHGIEPSLAGFSDPDFLQWFESLIAPVLKSEVAALSPESGFREVVLRCFATNQWEVVVPLGAGDQTNGLLGLGQKASAQPYTSADLDVLATLGAQASIAIENARLHERLRRSREVIHRSDRLSALGTLAAGIAHEIRNPLVSIHTFFQLAPARMNDQEFMTSFLALAETEVVRIRNLIGELLSYAKASEPEICVVQLIQIVDRAVALLLPRANEKGVSLTVEDVDVLPAVEADNDQLLQAILNVVLNAIDATDPGGSVCIVGSHQLEGVGEFSCLTIADTGRGIPPESLEAIFDPFFTTKDDGTGLGLAISHRIISDLGGFVTVSSVVSEGSQFVIRLPVASLEAQVAPPKVAAGNAI